MSADAAAAADAADAADAAAERRLNHSIPRTYFVRGIQLIQKLGDAAKCHSGEKEIIIIRSSTYCMGW